ncbi:dihydrofolate reductase [Parachitinimonas caeni]|uniref:Dihydrofolate reductase n=1 Tax=Parachitinimonas caeni TaxID=3031301 RepID=A0ABT7DW61_9NEIS|nr:dihydrofolate reductase [Parachitinimonas caeni]MDK2124288.1 dihydrofolate reductase [Parachitinimonas caeni]
MKANLSLIAAVARNGVVGIDNKLPWHLPDDLKYFKATTSGHPILMGRKTFESIGRPLPNRRNIVLTTQAGWQAAGCEVVHSLDAALALVSDEPEIFVIGGAQLYAATLPLAGKLYLTEIDADFAGDAYFPAFEKKDFQEICRDCRQTADFAYAFLVYQRIAM